MARSSIEAIGNTPLVELESARLEDGARVFATWEGTNPTKSVKDRMAFSMMIRGAEADGDLRAGQNVIDFTDGSAGSSSSW